MQSEQPRWVSELLDLTGTGLDGLSDIPESDLLRSLRRILSEAGTLTEQYAAWDNHMIRSPDAGP